jgi:hypothetical protein
MGTLTKKLSVVRNKLHTISRRIQTLLHEISDLSALAQRRARQAMSNEVLLMLTFGNQDPVEDVLAQRLSKYCDRLKRIKMDLEFWIDTSFDESSAKVVHHKLLPSIGVAIIGGGVNSRASCLLSDIKTLLIEVQDLDRRLPHFAGPSGRPLTVREKSTDMKRSRPREHVFVAYSHHNRKWLNRLKIHLTPLQRKGALELWDDTRLIPGTRWREDISKALSKSSVAVLLVSADFLASDFIATMELPTILRREHAATGLQVVPVFVAPCRVPKVIADFHGINDPKRTLEDMSDAEADRCFIRLVDLINGKMAE